MLCTLIYRRRSLYSFLLENAGPSIQIIVKGDITDCLAHRHVDLLWGVSQGIIEVLPPEDCVDDDPENIDSLDKYIDTSKSGTVICIQVGIRGLNDKTINIASIHGLSQDWLRFMTSFGITRSQLTRVWFIGADNQYS